MKRLVASVAMLAWFWVDSSDSRPWRPPRRPMTTPVARSRLNDGQGTTASVTISNLRVTGRLDDRPCGPEQFEILLLDAELLWPEAVFSTGSYHPCNGFVTFSVDSAGVLTVSDSGVYIPSTLMIGPGSGTAQGSPYPQ